MKALALFSTVLIWYVVVYAYFYTVAVPLLRVIA